MAGIDYSGLGSGIGSIASGIGGLFSGSGFDKAAQISDANAAIVKRSTAIQEEQQRRQAYQVLGTTQANAEAGGGTLSGSAMDVYKSNVQQLSLNRALVEEQGVIEQNSWLEKAAADQGMAAAAQASGIGGILEGAFKIAAALPFG